MTSLIAVGLAWVWAAAMPMAYMDREYPSWAAKQELLRRCDLGQALIVGDSRAAAGIVPALLPVRTANLAVGGGEPIEALAAVRRALRCPDPPRRVIVSFDAVHFVQPELFWERTVRFGFLDARDLAELRNVSRRLDDLSVYEERHTDSLPSRVRDGMYMSRFPSTQFASLVKSGVFMRWWQNRRILAAGLRARGYYTFGTAAGSDVVAGDGHLSQFRPLPVLDWYFDRLLALLNKRGIEVDFVSVPMNDATWQAMQPVVRRDFAAYLDAYAQRYPSFHVIGEVTPHWPDRWFGDGFAHLNPLGAERFSVQLAQWLAASAPSRLARAVVPPPAQPRLQAAPPSTQNEAQKGWFKEIGLDASASVRPSSKRGS